MNFKYRWDDSIVDKIKRDGKDLLILSEKPLNVTSPVTFNQVYNKVFKDLIIRSEYLNGKNVQYKPSWDCFCDGIQKKILELRPNIPHKELKERCILSLKEKINEFEQFFKSLGILADWDNAVQTMSEDYAKKMDSLIKDLYRKKIIYKKNSIGYWSVKYQKFVKDYEIFETQRDRNIAYVEFKMDNNVGFLVQIDELWKLPYVSNIVLNKNEVYYTVHLKNEKDKVIVSQSTFNNLIKERIVASYLLSQHTGSDFDTVQVKHPYGSCRVTVNDCDIERGTGCYVLYPDFLEDEHLDSYGRYLDGPFKDLSIYGIDDFILKHEQIAEYKTIKHLFLTDKDGNYLLKKKSSDFFISTKKLKAEILRNLSGKGQEYLSEIIKNKSDFSITSDQAWGIPLAFIENNKGEIVCSKELLNKVNENLSSWDEKDVEFFDPWNSDKFKITKDCFHKVESCLTPLFTNILSLEDNTEIYFEDNFTHLGYALFFGRQVPKKIIASDSVSCEIPIADLLKTYNVDVLRYLVANRDPKKSQIVQKDVFDAFFEYGQIKCKIDTMIESLAFSKFQTKDEKFFLRNSNFVEKFRAIYTDWFNFDFHEGLKKYKEFLKNDFLHKLECSVVRTSAVGNDFRDYVNSGMFFVLRHSLSLLLPIIPNTVKEYLNKCPDGLINKDVMSWTYEKI